MTMATMTKSWAAVIAPLALIIAYAIGMGFVAATGTELTETQMSTIQEVISSLIQVLFITAGVGGAVGIARKLIPEPKP
jgi:cell division GTPase FtsZ